ncbi:MAG TPA: glucose-6-phosphate isomerase [Sporichthyaceae bacterium]|jgi:glucose-6-phosphate isomerase|nr:glucose-6-phosphate isomerase [Sporichthyaceae bacterium]
MSHPASSAAAAGVTVRILDDAVREAAAAALLDAIGADTAPRLAEADPTLWGPEAQPEASIRLGWMDVTVASRGLLPQLRELVDWCRSAGLNHVVLAGMGGSSLAPEVITRSAGKPLTVLDTTDPGQVRRALADRLDRTVVVVASKSGGTVETDSHRRVYEKAFADGGLTHNQIAARIVVVTDPGSPLEKTARDAGYRVFLADPNIGGRYSALSAFGLVPSALAGVDVEALLDAADAVRPALAENEDNPGLLLGAALGGAVDEGRDKLVIGDLDPALVGFGDWAEQLIAESTGKAGTGILPVVVEGPNAPGWVDAGPDSILAALGDAKSASISTTGPLGAQFLVWEYATAVAGRSLGINPFDQPNVTESKENTNRLLADSGPDGPVVPAPLLTDGPVEVYGDPHAFDGAKSLTDALETLLASVEEGGYLAVMAYLDRFADADAAGLRPALARRLRDRQVTFGWGPRFLHSTGQFHKGGPQVGVFLQLTGAVAKDLAIPGRPFTFGALHLAQALGDLGALTGRGRPALRLHLTDRQAGLESVLAAIGR